MSAFVLEVLSLFEDEQESVMWRVQQDGTVRFFATCSDVFHWGCADCEEITEANLPVLREAFEDLGPDGQEHLAGELFAARVRGMRPQGAMYKYIDGGVRHLFDACGPERETGFGNPQAQP
jgi:hypothetical protein